VIDAVTNLVMDVVADSALVSMDAVAVTNSRTALALTMGAVI
jgi:hypothetical protein